VAGLRSEDVDLTGRSAEARRLPSGTPSIAVVNNRVAAGGAIYEGAPKGKGLLRAPYLPIPAVVVHALTTLQLVQLTEAEAAGTAYGSCRRCSGRHLVANEIGQTYRPEWYGDQFVRQVKAAGMERAILNSARLGASLDR